MRLKKSEDGPVTRICIPPVGMGSAAIGWIIGGFVSGGWALGMLQSLSEHFVGNVRPGKGGFPPVLAGPLALIMTGVALVCLLRLLECFTARATLAIENGRLTVEEKRLLSVIHRVFEREENPEARCEDARVKVNGQSLYQLRIHVRSGGQGYFTGRPIPELEWLAAEVNKALKPASS